MKNYSIWSEAVLHFKNRFRFPIERLPVSLKPFSHALPLTYGADVPHGAVHGGHNMPFYLDLALLAVFWIFCLPQASGTLSAGKFSD